ncbi:MAG: periplasmic heavy metal sensor [Acidobacteria bacterium]|nr:periplasmic heavy metal sensor [Acidobacteriota bacterium]
MMLEKIGSKARWQVRVAATVIFLLGFAAGALALNAYRAWGGPNDAARGQDRFEQLVKELQLDEGQQTQVRQIFGDTREQLEALRKESEPRVKEIRRQADERMQKTLTAEQWQKFQKLMEERSARRRDRGAR